MLMTSQWLLTNDSAQQTNQMCCFISNLWECTSLEVVLVDAKNTQHLPDGSIKLCHQKHYISSILKKSWWFRVCITMFTMWMVIPIKFGEETDLLELELDVSWSTWMVTRYSYVSLISMPSTQEIM